MFGGLIAAVYVAHIRFALNAVLAFWLAYILTRPLGASIGDYLSQPTADGGRGLGTTVTSAIFLSTISAVVVFLSITKRDRIESELEPLLSTSETSATRVLVVANKIAATTALVDAVRERAVVGPAEFIVLVPNPAHLPFDLAVPGGAGLGLALAQRLAGSAGGEVAATARDAGGRFSVRLPLA